MPASISRAAATWLRRSMALPTSCNSAASRNSSSYGPLLPGQLEDLQAVIEHVALGMLVRRLHQLFQRQEQQLVGAETIDRVFAGLGGPTQGPIGGHFGQKLLLFGAAGPGDGPQRMADLAVAGQVGRL